jgi:AcrR family transcriptional regulator
MHDTTQRGAVCQKTRRGRPVALSCEARRAAIFAALEAVHAEAGLDGATMQAIASRAGMSKRTLYEIFPSRTALLRCYLDTVADQFISPLPEIETGLPIAERLERMLSRNARHQGYGLPLEILRAFVAQVPVSPDIGRDLVEGVMQRDLAILTEEIERGIARGEIAPDEDAESAAALLLDMVRPWPVESLLDPARLAPPDAFAARRRLAIRVFLNGMAAPARDL